MPKAIDVKYTIWGRYSLPDDTDMNEIIESLKKHREPNAAVVEVVGDVFGESDVLDFNIMISTEEFITPEENEGEATIEVYADVDSNEMIWSNKLK